MSATASQTDQTSKIPLGAKVTVEWMRMKRDASDPDDHGKRIVESSRKVYWRGQKNTFIQRGKGLHLLDTEAIIWEAESKGRLRRTKGHWKIQIDPNFCEPLKNGQTYRSPIVSLILRDEVMAQLILIAQTILPIQITRTMAITTLVFATMAGFFTLAISPSIAPTTVVHWLTSPPKVLP